MERSPYSALSLCRLTIYSARLRPELSSNPENLPMSRLHSIYAPLVAISGVLFSGALSVQTRSSSPIARPTFLPQLVPLAEDNDRLVAEPSRIIEAALKALDPKYLHWLEVRIRQRMWDQEFAFEADSRLVLGPNHCARLETAVRQGGEPGRVLVVCDGSVLAHLVQLRGGSQHLKSLKLPAHEEQPVVPSARDRMLADNDCSGPYALLADLATRWKNLQVTPGLLNKTPALRLIGTLDSIPPAAADDVRRALPVRSCRLFLDAQTMLPIRLEWWSEHGIILELEYRAWRINRPLSHEECEKEFTFDPA